MEGSEREVAIEKPKIATEVPSIFIRARIKPYELVRYHWFIQLDLPVAEIEPRWFFRKPLRMTVVAIRDMF
jgi:hypothetical protein